MSFGRRLALFFVLIVLVPTLALVGILLIVSEDSREGKADAGLAATLQTAIALYDERVADAAPAARELAKEQQLADGLRSGNPSELRAFARSAAARPGVAAVEVLGPAGTTDARAGEVTAIAFYELELARGNNARGRLLVSVTTADQYAADLQRLTGRDSVVDRDGRHLAATVPPPDVDLEPGQTADVELAAGDHRAHLLSLDEDRGESALVLGPEKEGGVLAIEGPAVILLVAFLALAIVLAYFLAKTLTSQHLRVAEQAITDPLTGLWNRRRMDQLLRREVDRAMRFDHQLSMLIVDVDDFKRINDQHGHLVGDEVLTKIADALHGATRSIDVGARYGGDELALILIETGADGAEILAERLCDRVRATEIDDGHGNPLRVTISVGLATLPAAATEADSLIDAADQALLIAKRAGKDQIRIAPGAPRAQTNGQGRRPKRAARPDRRPRR